VELILPTGPGPRMHMRHFLSLSKKFEGFEPVSGMVDEEWGTVESGMARAKFWLRKPNAPTAFICSPIHAEGLVAGFESANRSFSQDYSLIVFLPEESDELKLGHALRPVTTLTFPMHEIARQAGLKLFQRLDLLSDSKAKAQEKVPCTIRQAESCGPVEQPAQA
jgi:DNA-binding LacI/PurR family transcriptional regulator